MINSKLEQDAENLKRKANVEANNKNYDVAIILLRDAIELYQKLGFQGQIGILNNQIQRYQKALDFEKSKLAPEVVPKETNQRRVLEDEGENLLQTAKNQAALHKYSEALKTYEEAYKIFKELGFNYQLKQITWQMNKIKVQMTKIENDAEAAEEKDLTIAELRQKRLERQKLEKEKKKIENEQETKTIAEKRKERFKLLEEYKQSKEEEQQKLIEERKKTYEYQKKREERERKEKLRLIEEQKKKQEEMVVNADNLLEAGKECIKNKDFKTAKGHYKEAIDIFINLGWDQQVQVLQTELKNIDIYEEQHKKKMKQEFLRKKKQEKEFQNRVDELLAEKKKEEEKRLAQMRALSPELKKNLEKAKLVIQKAEKEIELDKINRAIGRFEYVIELYNTIPEDKMDLTRDIKEIEEKLIELRKKLN